MDRTRSSAGAGTPAPSRPGGTTTGSVRAESRPRVSVFTEARFGRGQDDEWRALHRAEASALERFRRAGYDVTVVARGLPSRTPDGVGPPTDVASLPNYLGPSGFVRALPRLVPAVFRAVRDADRIVVHMPGAIGGVAATVCRLTRRRYAAEIVGEPVAVLGNEVGGRGGRWLARVVGRHTRWTVRGASHTAYVTREALQRLFPPAPGSASIGVSDLRLAPEQFVSTASARVSTPAQIVTVGHQDQRHKGHDILLRAIALLRRDGLDVGGTVVGGGRRHDELRALRDELGLSSSVVMAGTVNDHEALTAILDEATIFVLPSWAGEGLPRALVEAMARGLPAVATSVGGVPELLDPSCLVGPGDVEDLARGLRRLLEAPEHRAAMARVNLEVARRYEGDTLERRWRTWAHGLPPSQRDR